mmetsp:Transcript_19690/g.29213  ORF Transcript_19690/g.29213 Transcript_19690/m.29213 type:complete len:622 (+) Transcript_19690:73-1938(+)|eukprot:CAMPEP_0194220186 /NCGR_PEP_ID=MMETSP0156-20130528/27687_1 /TAXON_ID=33649 /ORGANISM="Thalassionema nitzschioides, Strain L26-B" /LENGTH=621 /DNA_ID=CAMNT_0038950119 /DNA_START=45 /DNA_END=1910 /DNA_ORIENTATION=-
MEREPTSPVKKQKLITKYDIIYLNVGGSHFDVSLSTLQKVPYFHSLLNNELWNMHKDRHDRIFIDRDGQPFADILTYLRQGEQALTFLSPERLAALELEADYFCMKDIVNVIKDISPTPGASFAENWAKGVKDPSSSWWKMAGGDKMLIDYDYRKAHPGCFEVQKKGTYLVLFHHESAMPHMDNIKGRYDPLAHLYTQSHLPAIDSVNNDHRSVVRIGNIDIRKKLKLEEDGLTFCTHSGVDVVEFQKGEEVAIAVSVAEDYMKETKNYQEWRKDRRLEMKLFHQVTMIPFKSGIGPCRARLERVLPKKLRMIANWSEKLNNGLVCLSDDGTRIIIQESGVYFVCGQVAARYAADDEYPNGFRFRPFDALGESVWMEQNHGSSLKFRKKLLTFHSGLEDDSKYAPMRKNNFQLGRIADILIGEKGDELLIRSERNVVLNDKEIWKDRMHRGSRINPEFLDLTMLKDAQFKRFRSTSVGEDFGFAWESLDEDTDADFIRVSTENKRKFLTIAGEDELMSVLVLATFPTVCTSDTVDGERIGLEVEGDLQIVSFIANGSGHFQHINTVSEVGHEFTIGFKGFSILGDRGVWVQNDTFNDFNLLEGRASVTFVKFKSINLGKPT